ncbi:MAG: ABC transporter ATP-binding protein [Bacteroidetes bacterium]|nr:ABC transporter ATP-binding protein [Bacteroidota bacterium]MBU1719061.1 ABC transporter ATP-binding protein [Bacteroidota bacterium]
MIRAEQISIGYKTGGKSARRTVCSGISFHINKAGLVCLLGRNGVGKSTLLRTIAGAQPLLSGEVLINGTSVRHLSPSVLAKSVSIVTASPPEIGHTRVAAIVETGRFPYINWMGNLDDSDREIISDALASCKADHLADRFFDQLSDGEKQKVMIARALAQNTPIILLDEPTAHLDAVNRFIIMDLLHSLAENHKKTILISTHDLDIALRKADLLLLIDESSAVCDSSEKLIAKGQLAKYLDSGDYHFDADERNFRKSKL